MAEVVLDGVSKVYGDGTSAVTDLDLDIGHAEFLVLVGPSGCGKTTALRMVAGLEDITAGQVRIGDKVVNDVPSRDRDVAMVFQSYALYPHLNVAENIGFGLKLRKVPKAEIERRVRSAAEVLGLTDHLRRKPRNLSGGQRQRVAMGRAIVRKPQAFLMDEPLSNLDAKLRVQTRAEIARLQRELQVTTIYVTHDQTEAMTLGHRVAVMNRGLLQQVDAPQVLYDRPVNVFVAGFIGSPAMNLVEARPEDVNGQVELAVGSQRLPVPAELLAQRPALRSYLGRTVMVGVRPEDMEDAALAEGPSISATVDLVEAMGSDVVVHLRADTPAADVGRIAGMEPPPGPEAAGPDRPGATAGGDRGTALVARFSPRTEVKEGQNIRVQVDTGRLHLFDPETGLSVWGT